MKHFVIGAAICFGIAILSGCGEKTDQESVPTNLPTETVQPTKEAAKDTAKDTAEEAEEEQNTQEQATPAENREDASVPTQATTPAPTPVDTREFTMYRYPTLYSDIPDLDIIRVGESYYMVSTTMNLCPGVPVMKSTDLVHWEIVNYVYETLEKDDTANLENGKDMYARGSWAASIKYNETDGLYYVAFNSNDYGFYIFTTEDIENGTWTKYSCKNGFHDPALFFHDGKLFVISASGDSCRIQELSLDSDRNAISLVGASKKLFSKPDTWGLWEGAHVYQVGDYYYIFLIASPTTGWMRTELCYRSRDLFSTEWEEKIVYKGGSGGNLAGLAQGGIVQTQLGDWYAFLFQDRGAVGRVPSIVSVSWQEGWPLMGTYQADGTFMQNHSDVASKVYLPQSENENCFVGSDNFSYQEGESLKKVWQWNHNPKNEFWSLTEREGYLRLTTDVVAENIYYAHNSLTQRTYGPECLSETKLLTDGLKPGDYAGLCAVADHYGMVGVLCDENGDRYIFQANGEFKTAFEAPEEVVPEKLQANQEVYVRAAYSFKEDSVEFSYSLDGLKWNSIGNKRKLGFSTSTTFMGTRSWLFCYATKEAGGYVDFDYYLVYDSDEDREKERKSIMTMEEIKEYERTTITETECPAALAMRKAGVGYGTVTHITYHSDTTGLDRGASILLPEGYSEEKKYPIIYFLHGIFGDEYGLVNDTNNKLPEILGNLVAEERTRETIIVFPNMYATSDPNQKPAFNSQAVLPYDNFINDLVNDLIPYIESNYSVLNERENRGILGFSMGGRETIFIGISRPDLFGYIGAIAPAPGILPTKDAFMTHEGQLKEEAELTITDKENLPELFLVCCGSKDSVVGKYPMSYHEILEKNETAHLWYEVPGADHDAKAIRSGYYNFLIRWNREKTDK